MTEEEINIIIANGEGVRLEFKKAENEVPKSLYETICAFLNKEGGTILLGWRMMEQCPELTVRV
jgi:ATP-dependent DNA helicase RecG